MSIENAASYIETIQTKLRTREAKVKAAIRLLGTLFNKYAFAGEGPDEDSIDMPCAYRDQDPSSDTTWFEFKDPHGDTLTPEDLADSGRPAGTVVEMWLGHMGDSSFVTKFTTYPENVFGYDGAPLGTTEIEGVIVDLRRYEAAVQASRVADPVGPPMGHTII